jgi:chromosomal replication initiator protein
MTSPFPEIEAGVMDCQTRSMPLLPTGIFAIIEAVAKDFVLPVAALIGPARPAVLVRPRHIVCWVAYQTGRFSLPQIGRALGDRDHTTILHAIRKIDEMRKRDTRLLRYTDLILRRFP